MSTVTNSPVAFTEVEIKLLRLVLNKEAAPGEVSTGAQKLIESLRRRGVEAHAIEQAFVQEPLPAKRIRPDFGLTVMLWGRCKGKRFMDIPPSELRSAISWARRTPGVAEKFSSFLHDAEEFLKQGQN